jgi:hypothetical protein
MENTDWDKIMTNNTGEKKPNPLNDELDKAHNRRVSMIALCTICLILLGFAAVGVAALLHLVFS